MSTATRRRQATTSRPDPDRAGWTLTAAFVALPACFVAALLVVDMLVPAVVAAPDPSAALKFLPPVRPVLAPEPVEQARYVAAVVLSLLLPAATLLLARRPAARPAHWACAALAAQAALVALVVVCWWRQLHLGAAAMTYFHGAAWLVAAQIMLVAVTALVVDTLFTVRVGRRPGGRAWRVPRRAGSVALGVLALVITVLALLSSVYRGSNIALGTITTTFHLPFTLDELALVRAGQTPLVDVTPQYASVLPYLAWPVFAVFGTGVGQFTVLMTLLTGLGFVAVLLGLRRLTAGWPSAIALYVPVLWLAMWPIERRGDQLSNIANYYSLAPMRYLGPLLLFGLVAWAVGRPGRRRLAVLGLVAGLTMLNDISFGLPAFAGAGLALLAALTPWARERRPPAGVWAASFVGGAFVALALFCLLALLRTGELPHLGDLTFYSRLFALGGFFMVPIHDPWSLALIMFLTHVAALTTALVLAGRATAVLGERDRVAVALLAYAGVFGLGSGTYYVGRSLPPVLVGVFLPWGMSLAVLAVVALRGLRGLPRGSWARRLLIVPAGLVLAHLALAAGTLTDTRAAFHQLRRLNVNDQPRTFDLPAFERAVRGCAKPGEHVMIAVPLGHEIAARTGVSDRFPFSDPDAVVSYEQMNRVTDVLRHRDVHWVFERSVLGSSKGEDANGILRRALPRRGFRLVASVLDGDGPRQALSTGEPINAWHRIDAGPVPAGCGATR